ncbi:hypothetical protein ACFLT1_09130 [Bacteroidota bacterium]
MYYSSDNPSIGALELDKTKMNIDPLFVDKASGNYRLTNTSKGINAGIEVGYDSDVKGIPVHGLPDLGAFEFLED